MILLYHLEKRKQNPTMRKIENITPGEILLEEFIKPLKISAYKLAKDTGMPATRVSQILKGKRRKTENQF